MIERLSADWKNQTPVDQMWKKINEIIDWINNYQKMHDAFYCDKCPESMSRNVPKEQTRGCGKQIIEKIGENEDLWTYCGTYTKHNNTLYLCDDCKKGEMK